MAGYSDRIRRDAIWALECCADRRVVGDEQTCTWTLLGQFPRPASCRLAGAAFMAVDRATFPSLEHLDTYLEAAALLRDGWCPGDPVEVRR